MDGTFVPEGNMPPVKTDAFELFADTLCTVLGASRQQMNGGERNTRELFIEVAAFGKTAVEQYLVLRAERRSHDSALRALRELK